MTARVCEVHGEYAPTGTCRWCEEPSGANQSTITLPLMCICKTCLRSFEAPIPLTSLLCPECRGEAAHLEALNTPLYVEVPPPCELTEAMVGLSGRLPPAPTFLDVAQKWQAKHPILPQVEFMTQTNPFADEEPRVWNFYGFDTDGTIIHDWWEKIRLNEQHAALRWERVARRWGSKRRPLTWGDLLERLTRPNPLLQDAPWKEPTR